MNIFRNLPLPGGGGPAYFQGFVAPGWPPADITNLSGPFDSVRRHNLCFLPMEGAENQVEKSHSTGVPEKQIIINKSATVTDVSIGMGIGIVALAYVWVQDRMQAALRSWPFAGALLAISPFLIGVSLIERRNPQSF